MVECAYPICSMVYGIQNQRELLKLLNSMNSICYLDFVAFWTKKEKQKQNCNE